MAQKTPQQMGAIVDMYARAHNKTAANDKKTRRVAIKLCEHPLIPGVPAVVPVDAETGEELYGVRKCEVVTGFEDVTLLRIELLLLDEK